MSVSTVNIPWIEQWTKWQQQLATVGNELPWLTQLQHDAMQSFERIGIPTRKQEQWRYVNLDTLLSSSFKSESVALDCESYFIPNLESYRFVFMDNHFQAALSASSASLPKGVVVKGLSSVLAEQPELVQQWLQTADIQHNNNFTALNSALLSDGFYIHLDTGVQLDKPIEILYLSSAQHNPTSSMPRVLLALDAGAHATVIERFCGTGEQVYFQNSVAQITLAADSQLTHYRLLQEQNQGYHLSTISVTQQQQSVYRNLNFEFNGAWLRTDIDINLVGSGAECQLDGLYLVDHGQQAEVHLDVKHQAPSCNSKQNYKGLLMGKGRTVFDGKIMVEKDAQQSDAHMLNSNLILCEGAEADTKPQLEIYADNVQCSHGTTVGQLEAEQLFYLRSRGIAEHDAFRLLCQGYAAEILSLCTIPALTEFVETQFQQTLKWNQ